MPNSKKKADATSESGNGAKPIVSGSYMYRRTMEMINNPQPLSKPPYSCPLSAYGRSKDCQFPNCLCEWRL